MATHHSPTPRPAVRDFAHFRLILPVAGWDFAFDYNNGLVLKVGKLPTHLAHLSQLHIYR
jgi:hypothetical protein